MQLIRLGTCLIIFLFIITSCGDDPDFAGNGITGSELREHDNFTQLDVSGVFDVVVTQADEYRIEIEGDENLLSNVLTQVRGETLEIKLEKGSYKTFNLKVIVSMPLVTDVDVSEVGDLTIEDFSDLDMLEIDHSGVGDVFLMNGSSAQLTLDKAGVGDLHAFDFIVEKYDIDQAGLGDIEVTCTEELKGSISGIGDLYYKGQPTIDIDRSGLGEIIDAN